MAERPLPSTSKPAEEQAAPPERSAARFFRAAAVAALAVVLGVFAWSFWRAGQAQPPPRPAHLPPPRAAAPSFEQPPQPAPGLGGSQAPNILAEVEGGALKLYDEQGVYAEIDYKTLTPKPAGRIDLDSPSAWLLLDGGRAVRLRAERGRLTQPPGASKPESGQFEGQVRVELFTFPGGDSRSASRTEADLPPADLIVQTERVRFDLALGEIEAPGPLDAAGPGVRATLSNLVVRIDEQDRSLALLVSDGPGLFAYNFAAARRDEAADTTAPPAEQRPPSGASAPQRGDSRTPVEHFYHAQVDDAVNLRWGSRAAVADRLELWARLLDNRLPEGAIFSQLQLKEERSSANAAPSEAPSPGTSPGKEAATFEDGFVADVLARWTGPLRVEPSSRKPRQLRDDDVFLSLSAPRTGKTTLRDDAAQVRAACVSLEAGLTRGVVALVGAGDVGVTIERQGAGAAIAGRFELDLARGIGTFPGPGVVRAGLVEPGPDLPPLRREISWRGGADLLFATREGGIDLGAQAPLREAVFREGVEAREGDTLLTGGSLRALFAPATGLLARLVVEGQALLDADERGRLAADRLDVRFQPAQPVQLEEQGGGLPDVDVEPVVATAEGSVRAQRGGASLRADLAEATFGRGEGGELLVTTLNASGEVRVRTPEGAQALAHTLRADLVAQSAQLTGSPASIAQEGARVEGASISLTQQPGSMTVFGPGSLVWTPRTRNSSAQQGYDHIEARFTGVFEFDREALTARFAGGVQAKGRGPGVEDALTCEALDLWLDEGTNDTKGSTGQRLATLTIAKAVAQGDSEKAPATIERRQREIDPTGAPRLTQLVYLEGRLVEADNEAGTLRVPTAGRLLVERREHAQAQPLRAEDDGNAMARLAGSPGTTLFEWQGQLLLDRPRGVAAMTKQVRMRHLPRGAAEAAMIECERMEATFDTADAPDEAASRLRLTKAEARGAVYAAMGLRELIADALLYDARKAALAARANPPNAIILFDRSQPTPLTGSALVWRLDEDRVEWRDAGTLSAPAAGIVTAQPSAEQAPPPPLHE